MHEVDPRVRLLLPRYSSLLLITIIGLCLSVLLYSVARKSERSKLSLTFKNDAGKKFSVLMKELAVNLHEIDDLRTYYESSELVTREEFTTYTSRTTNQFPAISAEMWVPRVPFEKRGEFERKFTDGGGRKLSLTERGEKNSLQTAGSRKEYFPIRYIEPYEANEKYMGFDLASEGEIGESLYRARDTGALALVKHFKLFGVARDHLEYLVIYPLYHRGAPTRTVEGRREALEGFLIGVLNLKRIIDTAFSDVKMEPFDLYLFDGPPKPGTPLLFHYREEFNPIDKGTLMPPSGKPTDTLRYAETINLEKLNLNIILTPTAKYLQERETNISIVILLGGFLMTGFLAFYIYAIKKHHSRTQQFASNLLQARDALTRERNRAQKYLDIAGVIIVALNREGEIMLINRKGTEMFGYEQGELSGENWFQKCIPEKAREEVSTMFRNVMDGEIDPFVDFEYPIITKSGEERIITWQNSLITDERGTVTGKLSSGEDVTLQKRSVEALKESEGRFRDLVESALTGIFIIQEGAVVYRNPELTRLLGYFTVPIPLNDLAGIHPADRKGFLALLDRVDSGARKAVEGEFRYAISHKGRKRQNQGWVYCRGSAIEYRGKSATLVNVMDITRAKELELVLKDKMTSLGRVAAGIAHEIRNPLSGINIYTNTLKKAVRGLEGYGGAEDIIKQIQAASGKIESVVRKALDFSKPGHARYTLIDLNVPVEEAIKLSSVSHRKSGIEIEKELDRGIPSCYADKGQIEQVILNLISNSAEAMTNTEGPRKIVVSTSSENNTILLRVADNGPGVPDSVQDRIFDPFFTTKSENTGLGLSISSRIVLDHGGHIEIGQSQWGGAEFVVRLPIERRKISR